MVKLERTLAAMEGIDGSEVDTFWEALARAEKKAASRDTDQRLQTYLVEAIDAQRATVVASIEEGTKRFEF